MNIVAISGGSYTYVNGEKVYTGVKGVGKDTLALILRDMYRKTHDVYILNLAKPIKSWISDHYDLEQEIYDRPENKEKILMHSVFAETKKNWSYRLLAEELGTEIVRNGIKSKLPNINMDPPQVWVDKVMNRIHRLNMSSMEKSIADIFDLSDYECFGIPETQVITRLNVSRKQLMDCVSELLEEREFPVIPEGKPKLFIIPDLRFMNEYETLKLHGAKIFRVERYIRELKPPVNPHPSNQVNLNMVPDLIIDNNMDLSDFPTHIKLLSMSGSRFFP